ncbi:MAG: hypothetical protein VX498_12325 [Myxococcota bacterium]|nr:hypothetical protein [Myxococcota bacterium]
MGRCCGGKNAGKPITLPRYLAGIGVFCSYHAAVQVLLRVAARPIPHLREVRDFQAKVFRDELREILQRDEIHVTGLLRSEEWDPNCEVGVEALAVTGSTRPEELAAAGLADF